MTEDSMWLKWQKEAPAFYDEVYYRSNPLVRHFNLAGHSLIEKHVGANASYSKVLEVGAGTGQHFEFVRHKFDCYYITDISEGMLQKARARLGDRPDVSYEIEDAAKLSFPDASFDRLISCYNLEHLPAPHLVLKEWRRVLKPNGLLTVALPTEGGVAWRLGRWLTTRRAFRRKGLDLDYIIAREHVNSCYNLSALLRNEFSGSLREIWYPSRLPVSDLNLIYVGMATA